MNNEQTEFAADVGLLECHKNSFNLSSLSGKRGSKILHSNVSQTVEPIGENCQQSAFKNSLTGCDLMPCTILQLHPDHQIGDRI